MDAVSLPLAKNTTLRVTGHIKRHVKSQRRQIQGGYESSGENS
jgi:hypothetical protein